VSPSKTQPVNPYNTPETSPVRRNIFKTEHEAIQEAVGELNLAPGGGSEVSKETYRPTRGGRKRARNEEDDVSGSEGDGGEDIAPTQKIENPSGRISKILPGKHSPSVLVPEVQSSRLDLANNVDGESEVNPFLVTRADSNATAS
jgi:hypothetical protein